MKVTKMLHASNQWCESYIRGGSNNSIKHSFLYNSKQRNIDYKIESLTEGLLIDTHVCKITSFPYMYFKYIYGKLVIFLVISFHYMPCMSVSYRRI